MFTFGVSTGNILPRHNKLKHPPPSDMLITAGLGKVDHDCFLGMYRRDHHQRLNSEVLFLNVNTVISRSTEAIIPRIV